MLLEVIASLVLAAQSSTADFKTEYEELERGFDAAQDAYYAPLRKATSDEERAKVKLDPKLEPGSLFVEKFKDLARRAKGDDAGAHALLWLVENGADVDASIPKAAARRARPGIPRLAADGRAAQTLRHGSDTVGRERALEVLGQIEKGSPLPNAKAAALYVSGALLLEKSGGIEEAKTRFQRVQKEFGDTPWAARAGSSLFEAEHLQIGMTAPRLRRDRRERQAVEERGAARQGRRPRLLGILVRPLPRDDPAREGDGGSTEAEAFRPGRDQQRRRPCRLQDDRRQGQGGGRDPR
jgi:hypothetical protein